MDTRALLAMFDDCDFNNLTESDYEEKIINRVNLTDEFKGAKFCAGVSKVVIVPREAPYVIKIPFYGSWVYDDDCSCSFYLNSEEYNDDDDYSHDTFFQFEEANDDTSHYWDYCFTEALLYHDAEKAKVNEAFAKTRFVGYAQNGAYPIYIQQKAKTYNDTNKNTSLYPKERTDKSTKICLNNFAYIFNSVWLTDALEYYGEKQYRRILNFMTDSGINDLHNDNIGYINNKPVFIDYSGWCE